MPEALEEPELVLPAAPTAIPAPKAPVFGVSKYGTDWSGLHPFLVEMPVYVAPKLPKQPSEVSCFGTSCMALHGGV